MPDFILTVLYWLGNFLIVLWSVFLAFSLWQENKRILKSVGLILFGICWHVAKAVYHYRNGTCESLTGNENWLVIANQCIPPWDYDVVYAQVAILAGFLVLMYDMHRLHSRNSDL